MVSNTWVTLYVSHGKRIKNKVRVRFDNCFVFFKFECMKFKNVENEMKRKVNHSQTLHK